MRRQCSGCLPRSPPDNARVRFLPPHGLQMRAGRSSDAPEAVVIAVSGRWQLAEGGVRTNWCPLPSKLSHSARLLVEELRTRKDSTGLSLARISARTHYSRSSWERWLNGKRPITPQALLAFAEVADFDATHLLSLLGGAGAEPRVVLSTIASSPRAGNGYAAAWANQRPAVHIAQLPPDIRDFIGRQAHVRALAIAVTDSRPGPGQLPVTVICGPCGVGKTTLTTHVAHLVRDRFPDGSLYADLGGTDPVPRDAADVLADWLHALGDRLDQLASSVQARAARLRTLTRDRRYLLLLDDARSSAQLKPLLPAAEACAVLVTSRRRLADLDGAQRFVLEPMGESEALTMLESIVGADRLAAEPVAAKAIVTSCGGLPLALRIAGARLSARPAWHLQSLATRLADPRRALDELAIGDLSVRASLQASYAMLAAADCPVSPSRAFRLLSLTESPDITLAAAAALLGTSETAAELVLDALAEVHLLDEPAAGRYRLHHLTGLWAAELAEADQPSS